MRIVFEPEKGQRVPLYVWASQVAHETIAQLQQIASTPYVVEHVAAMADAHVSQSVAVGTVFATEHTVVPSALGGDLGCGVSAAKITIDKGEIARSALECFVRSLRSVVPTGSNVHRKGVLVPDALFASGLSTRSLEHTRAALAARHLGTLGGGNHFVELDQDADGNLWLLVHSGSRGLGAAIAAHHAKAAGAASLAGLDTRAEDGAAYLADLEWALLFAHENRKLILERAVAVAVDCFGALAIDEGVIDVHHNFVAREHWFGRDLLIHRKGAVAAPVGSFALVPGSMATASYVVEGLGCEASFGSCSHGAGRVMTRREARTRIESRSLKRMMKHVVYPEDLTAQLVEEAPAAYRDIVQVLDDQRDLVKRRRRLEPLAVLKG